MNRYKRKRTEQCGKKLSHKNRRKELTHYGKKRLFEDLLKIDEVTGVADVQFGIETLSPVKKSKKGNDYYDCIASDEMGSVRFWFRC